MPATESPAQLRTGAAARALRVNRSTVRRWVEEGKLEAVAYVDGYIFDAAYISEVAARHRTT